jgi:hypothetical protein
MRILITGVGGPTPRSFAIALKKYSRYKVYELIATDINPLAIGLYQTELFSKSYLVPKCTDINYWVKIEDIIKQHKIDMAVVLPELEVLEWSKRAEEGKLPCKALLPGSIIAKLLVDKAQMTRILDSLNLVPPSVEFDKELDNFTSVFDELGNDFWVRSSSGTSGLGSLRVDGEESLRNWIQINPNVSTFLASKFLPGRNLACKLLYFEGRLIRSACGERVNYIMAKVAPSGITGNTSFGRLLNEPKLVELATTAMEELFKFSNSAKQGFFTVDFKEDANGVPFITEINVRHVAFTQCFAAGGANFAEDTIRILDGDPSFNFDYKMYEFEKGLIFLRDVDSLPILMREENLMNLN